MSAQEGRGWPTQVASSDVSVIICAHTNERRQNLREAVASVNGQLAPPRETLVVVDHNRSLADWARAELDAAVVENDRPRGASGARNAGAARATGGVLAFLDDDAVASTSWLSALVAPFADSRVVGVGGRIDPSWAAARPRWFPETFLWTVGASYAGQYGNGSSGTTIRNIWTNNMAIRREAFDLVGGFLEGFGKIGSTNAPEDTELSLRVSSRFPQTVWYLAATAAVSHDVPRERTTMEFFLWRCYNEGLGKAALATLVGRAALSAETSFLAGPVPRAFFGEMGCVRVGDVAGLARAGAIAAGTTAAAAGYVAGLLRSRPSAVPGAGATPGGKA